MFGCDQAILVGVRGEHVGSKLLQGLHLFKDHLRDLSSGLVASGAQKSVVTDEIGSQFLVGRILPTDLGLSERGHGQLH
jgi:hypothetical protein